MQKVIVAGGAGFIGYHLCKKLLDEGYEVVCIDNFISGSRSNVEPFFHNPSYTFVETDIVKTIEDSVVAGAEFYFHLASPASPNKKSPRSYMSHPIETLLANSLGTYNLLEKARNQNASFLYASTSEVYGDPQVSPQNESYFGNVNPNGARSVYDEGKRFGEAISMAYFRKYNLGVRVARIFNTYGENMQEDDGRVISNFITQALSKQPITIYGEGKQTRSFCYVSDLVDGLYAMMVKSEAKGEVINLGNPVEYTIEDIAKKVKDLTQSQSEIVHEPPVEDDPLQRKPDISKANKVLGWSPKVELEEGLKKTIEYFRSAKREV